VTGRYNSLTAGESGGSKRFYYSPDAIASAGYTFLKADIQFNLDYKFTGKLPYLYQDSDGITREGFVDAYNTMDFTVQKDFFSDRLTLGAGVKNIFDVTTVPAVGSSGGVHTGGSGSYPVGWGRSVFIQASFNFNKF
jgi:hypothetical protein